LIQKEKQNKKLLKVDKEKFFVPFGTFFLKKTTTNLLLIFVILTKKASLKMRIPQLLHSLFFFNIFFAK